MQPTRHGYYGTPTYRTWNAMLQRCTNPNNRKHYLYGGRGITVCERWRGFINFLADMGERPQGKTLDRINPNGNYEPSNCRWATPQEQAQTKRPLNRTHCRNGHDYAEVGVYITSKGGHECALCRKVWFSKRTRAKPKYELIV